MLDSIQPPDQHPFLQVYTTAITKLKKHDKKHTTQLIEQNKLIVDFDKFVTTQNTTITELLNTVNKFEVKVSKKGALESRLKILEAPTVGIITKSPFSHVYTTSVTQKSVSSIQSHQHEPSAVNYINKCRKTSSRKKAPAKTP